MYWKPNDDDRGWAIHVLEIDVTEAAVNYRIDGALVATIEPLSASARMSDGVDGHHERIHPRQR